MSARATALPPSSTPGSTFSRTGRFAASTRRASTTPRADRGGGSDPRGAGLVCARPPRRRPLSRSSSPTTASTSSASPGSITPSPCAGTCAASSPASASATASAERALHRLSDYLEVVRETCGKKETDLFEPAAGKGAVARATFYFLLRYPELRPYSDGAIATLLRWAPGRARVRVRAAPQRRDLRAAGQPQSADRPPGVGVAHRLQCTRMTSAATPAPTNAPTIRPTDLRLAEPDRAQQPHATR